MFGHDLERLNKKATSGKVHVIDLGNSPLSSLDRGTSADDGFLTGTVKKQSLFV